MQETKRNASVPGSGRFPGGGQATHSSILILRIPWGKKKRKKRKKKKRIPWTEEPGRLVHRVAKNHGWSDLAYARTQAVLRSLGQSCPTLCDPMDRAARSPALRTDSSLAEGSLCLPQGNFPTQESD